MTGTPQASLDGPEGSPSMAFLFLPVGFGVAYGLLKHGYLLHWAMEAAIIAVLWGIGAFILRSWRYRAYVMNCAQTGQPPSPVLFMLLQTLSTGVVIFAVIGVVRLVRSFFA